MKSNLLKEQLQKSPKRPSLDFCNCSSRESDSVYSNKESNKGMICFQVELLRLRDLVRSVGLSLLRLEGLSEENIFLKKYFNSNGSIRVIQSHVIQIRVIEIRVIEIRIIKNSCYVRT